MMDVIVLFLSSLFMLSPLDMLSDYASSEPCPKNGRSDGACTTFGVLAEEGVGGITVGNRTLTINSSIMVVVDAATSTRIGVANAITKES
jgi:hypothetical protein